MDAPLRLVSALPSALSIHFRKWREQGNLPLLFVLPLMLTILGGLGFALLPAFGYFPGLGSESFSLAPWRALFAMPGWPLSLGITFLSGFGATLISVLLALGLLGISHATSPLFIRLAGLVLSIPHAALAIGLGFLIAPSGWLIRILAANGLGFTNMPNYQAPQDPWGLSLALALVIKETPFLFLIGMANLRRIDAERYLLIAQSLGYARGTAWLKVVLPILFRQMRLPIFAVLAYSLSVVDMALILGPTAPPTYILRVLQWANDPDLSLRFVAASAALFHTIFVISSLGLWQGGVLLIAKITRPFLTNGRRAFPTLLTRGMMGIFGLLGFTLVFLALASLIVLLLWSMAGQWGWPAMFPEVELYAWLTRLAYVPQILAESLLIALVSMALALMLSLACLEYGRPERGLWIIYAPLIIPEFLFIFGVAILLIVLHLDGNALAVIWAHILFIFPYQYLALKDAWYHLDPRYARAASSLGAGRWRIFLHVKLPLLRAPICNAAAIGFAVSLSLYLPTLLISGGRVSTLATEAVQLAAAGDRRITAMFALTQCLFVGLAYMLAHRLGKARSFSNAG